ncbi:MAG: DUF2130 domain-containing protein [Clostridia bacterium]|nr:DUF2130 domain-containing protein [Clostridia bacterium]
MQELKCPNCGKVFQVDDTGYAQIVQQVRDAELENEVARRERELAQAQADRFRLLEMEQERKREKEISSKNDELSAKEREIERLKAELDRADAERKLAVSDAVRDREKELFEKETAIAKLRGDLELQKKDGEQRESNLIAKHGEELKLRDEEIERLRDFKARQSTKMVGESLEQHCQAQFNAIRMTAFPNAYFEKDNDASSGSKGDFIFRESSGETEFISIMFEMKNESDTTATKHRNEDFFKELDKDRREKKCEYAVLVSLLESDNELYNGGIVDVSYRYPKMFVVRPQFFIPIISLLRNAALDSLEYRKKLAEVQNRQTDLTNFEENLDKFKSEFARSFTLASDRYRDAIDGIDKAISSLTRIRENLVKSENHLNTANKKLDDVNIRQLTKNAPSVREMFDSMSN